MILLSLTAWLALIWAIVATHHAARLADELRRVRTELHIHRAVSDAERGQII